MTWHMASSATRTVYTVVGGAVICLIFIGTILTILKRTRKTAQSPKSIEPASITAARSSTCDAQPGDIVVTLHPLQSTSPGMLVPLTTHTPYANDQNVHTLATPRSAGTVMWEAIRSMDVTLIQTCSSQPIELHAHSYSLPTESEESASMPPPIQFHDDARPLAVWRVYNVPLHKQRSHSTHTSWEDDSGSASLCGPDSIHIRLPNATMRFQQFAELRRRVKATQPSRSAPSQTPSASGMSNASNAVVQSIALFHFHTQPEQQGNLNLSADIDAPQSSPMVQPVLDTIDTAFMSTQSPSLLTFASILQIDTATQSLHGRLSLVLGNIPIPPTIRDPSVVFWTIRNMLQQRSAFVLRIPMSPSDDQARDRSKFKRRSRPWVDYTATIGLSVATNLPQQATDCSSSLSEVGHVDPRCASRRHTSFNKGNIRHTNPDASPSELRFTSSDSRTGISSHEPHSVFPYSQWTVLTLGVRVMTEHELAMTRNQSADIHLQQQEKLPSKTFYIAIPVVMLHTHVVKSICSWVFAPPPQIVWKPDRALPKSKQRTTRASGRAVLHTTASDRPFSNQLNSVPSLPIESVRARTCNTCDSASVRSETHATPQQVSGTARLAGTLKSIHESFMTFLEPPKVNLWTDASVRTQMQTQALQNDALTPACRQDYQSQWDKIVSLFMNFGVLDGKVELTRSGSEWDTGFEVPDNEPLCAHYNANLKLLPQRWKYIVGETLNHRKTKSNGVITEYYRAPASSAAWREYTMAPLMVARMARRSFMRFYPLGYAAIDNVLADTTSSGKHSDSPRRHISIPRCACLFDITTVAWLHAFHGWNHEKNVIVVNGEIGIIAPVNNSANSRTHIPVNGPTDIPA